MKDFNYYAPKTVKEAVSTLAKLEGDGKIMCGGQSMLLLMKQNMLTPENVVDIKGVSELDYIKYDKGKGLAIGALTTHSAVEKSSVIKKNYPVLAEMEDNLAVVQTRNWGTIGGNACHGDPAADPPAVFIALNAKYRLVGPEGERIVDAEDFYKDYLEVDIAHDELLCEVQVPVIAANTGLAHGKLMAQKGDMGVVGAAALVTIDPSTGVCRDARIVLTNVASTPFRARSSEKVLIGKVIDEKLLEEAGKIASEEVNPPADVHGSEEYRKDMARIFLKRVTAQALERAKQKK
ncbi:MAG: xanthine dehydrogenase family protein subunit M [Syntrophorhabdaceae bacterium]|nr:xanthine dehydrogenase family protein subunit M [Syntrophorhabdaceae bacterium]MDD5243422.1 xanthine dehydrogenase family protein subunit M [Syntrophorhabdaceae bacterium]